MLKKDFKIEIKKKKNQAKERKKKDDWREGSDGRSDQFLKRDQFCHRECSKVQDTRPHLAS